MIAIVVVITVLSGVSLDLIDEGPCTMPEAVLGALVDRMVVERRVVQHRLDLPGELIAILGDIGDLPQVACVDLVGRGDGAV